MSVRHLSPDYLIGMAVWLLAGLLAVVALLKLRRRWKTRPRRLLLVHSGLSVWMLLFLLTLVEIYFATVYDQTDGFNMTNVSKKWFKRHVEPDQKVLRFRSGAGIRYRDNVKFPASVPREKHHVCFIGDSFTFGHGVARVEDRFSNRVRRFWERKQPGKFVVSNLADAGTDLYWVEGVLKQLFADDYDVDTIVYVMCLNDIETFHEDRNKFYQELGEIGPRSLLFEETYFLNFLYFRMRQYTHPAVQNYQNALRELYDGDAWERMKRKLKSVRDLCRRHRTGFRVVVFPFLQNLGTDYAFRDVHERVVSHCRELKIPVLDLHPVLSSHVDDGLVVNRYDAHPNERAHQLAGEAIRERLLADLTDDPRGSSNRPDNPTPGR